MAAKTILVVSAVCFLFSCHSVRKDKASMSMDCIARVLAVDDSLGKIRNRECESISLSQTIVNYTDGMRKLNTEHCSEGFTNAFQSHIDAWNAIRVVTDRYPDKRGEMHVLFKELEQCRDSIEFKKLQAAIWSTWTGVEQSAKK